VNIGVTDQQLGKRIRASGDVRRHSQSSRAAALVSAALYPSPSVADGLVVSYENTARRRSSIRSHVNWCNGTTKLFRRLKKSRRPGAKLLPESCFFRLCRSQMPLSDRPEPTDFFRNHRKRNCNVMIGRRQTF